MPQQVTKRPLVFAAPLMKTRHQSVFALLLMRNGLLFGSRKLAVCVLALEGKVHGLNELLNCQGTDFLISLGEWSPAAGARVASVVAQAVFAD